VKNYRRGNVIKLSAAGRVAQRIETKALASVRKSLKSRSLGLDTALWAYSTSARFLNDIEYSGSLSHLP
jgi:hypothetical protein